MDSSIILPLLGGWFAMLAALGATALAATFFNEGGKRETVAACLILAVAAFWAEIGVAFVIISAG